jgi:diketogulonate reductase-like aldo/keto reductase
MGGFRAGRIAHEPVLREIADAIGATPHQVVIAWLLGLSPAIIPIPGASRPGNASSSARAASLRLSMRDMSLMDDTYLSRVQS